MIISGIDFPEPLLNAMRDGRLVIFAGAGVSMGPPANLPDFEELARQIADGTGRAQKGSETVDQFLRRLKSAGTDVHRLAAQFLQSGDPGPSTRHNYLLQLYARPEDVRIVTTNFDLLFEQAADAVFDQIPKVFEAPVLPLGHDFQGIVHIHGSVNEPTRMVLDAQDFGHAYLTEADGWARSFLIALFTNYTVLFVGYSHSDTIISYLTPSLSRDDATQRFALIGDQIDAPERWWTLGVEPITFQQAHSGDYVGLDTGLAGLTDHMRRGILDWRREIAAITSEYPPVDDENAAVIAHALTDPVLTRFFVETAELPEWMEWLDRRGHLAALFADGELSERDQTLAWWLTSRFAMAHDDALFPDDRTSRRWGETRIMAGTQSGTAAKYFPITRCGNHRPLGSVLGTCHPRWRRRDRDVMDSRGRRQRRISGRDTVGVRRDDGTAQRCFVSGGIAQVGYVQLRDAKNAGGVHQAKFGRNSRTGAGADHHTTERAALRVDGLGRGRRNFASGQPWAVSHRAARAGRPEPGC